MPFFKIVKRFNEEGKEKEKNTLQEDTVEDR